MKIKNYKCSGLCIKPKYIILIKKYDKQNCYTAQYTIVFKKNQKRLRKIFDLDPNFKY